MSRTAPVTALITTYNAGAFLAAAINSVQRQTLPVAEILVIDDGSSDGSGERARSLGAKVIRQENKGAPAARNAGVRAASQEWVAFLDHDDLWESEKIELQWRAHELCPDADLIVTDFCQFDDGSTEVQVPSVFGLPEAGFDRLERHFVADEISYLPKIDERVLNTIYKNIFFPSAAMVRRELAISAGLFQEDIFPMDDIDFFLRCFARTPLVFVERVLMRYRLHAGNASKNELRQYMSFFKFAQRMLDKPNLYPPGAVAIFTARAPLAQRYADAGRLMIDVGEVTQARRLLTESLRLRKSLRPALFWGLTWLGPAFFTCLLKAKRTLKD